ncbi:hypothetical protein GY45DRAFT_1373213 [Cubamyces sp. BRFM 1775]|nr:hypothetical protein GY45DRAFT_1373213 [Cubamyces sp. BRFM 1775]
MLSICALACLELLSLRAVFPTSAQDLAINVPQTLTQCVPDDLSWNAGSDPFTLTVNFNIAPFVGRYTPMSLAFFDDLGYSGIFDQITVRDSADSSCLQAAGDSTSMAMQSTSSPSTASSSSSSKSQSVPSPEETDAHSLPSTEKHVLDKTGALAGIAVGSAVAAFVLLLVLLRWKRRNWLLRRGAVSLEANRSSLAPTEPRTSGKAALLRKPSLLSRIRPKLVVRVYTLRRARTHFMGRLSP